jgi:hypothetical protein
MKGLYNMEFNYEDIDSDNQYLSNQLSTFPAETIPLVNIIIIGAILFINLV